MSSIDPTTPVTSDIDVTETQVYEAIADVLDPELDESLVKLGFIDRVQVEGSEVTVVFKLPTYWCAPNFAYLMASDLRARLQTIPGVNTARVILLDHFVEDEITQGVNENRPFSQAFAGETLEDEDLEELRRTFLRKGFLMRQDTLLRQLLKAGLDEATILSLHIADLVVDEVADGAFITAAGRVLRLERAGRNAALYLRKSAVLGLSQNENDLLVTDEHGQPISPGSLQEYLRRSRSIRLNIVFNTSMCTGLFRTRYEHAGASEAHREGDIV